MTTVASLIEKLKLLPQDLHILYEEDGIVHGNDNFSSIQFEIIPYGYFIRRESGYIYHDFRHKRTDDDQSVSCVDFVRMFIF